MRRSILPTLTALALVAIPFTSSHAQQAVSLMKPDQDDMGFRLNLGQEFPGAKATVTKDESTKHNGQPSLKLAADFTGGGRYVDASVPVDMDIRQLSFWVKNHQEPHLTIRVVDSNGRCHQINMESKATDGWQRIVFPLDTFFANQGTPNALKSVKKYQRWGGKKDAEQLFTGPAKSIHILTGPKEDLKKREIWINSLAVVPGSAGGGGGETKTVTAEVDVNEILDEEHFWGFHNGQEFGAAKGGIEVVKAAGGGQDYAIKVTGDFTEQGRYVSATKDLKELGLEDIEEIKLMVKSDSVSSVGVRMADGSGQTHQRNGIKIQPDGQWHELVLKPEEIAGGEHWGGKNDGKWHGAPQYLAINLGAGDPKVKTLFIGQAKAKGTMPATVGAVAYNEGFEGSDKLPTDWKATGPVAIDTTGAYKGKNAIKLSKSEATLRDQVEAVGATFPVGTKQIEASYTAKSDLDSMDNSYQGAVAMEFLNNGGTPVGRRELGILFKKNPWKTNKKTLEVPAGATAARFVLSIKKETKGDFWVDELAVAPIQGKQGEDRIDRMILSVKEEGNLLYPKDPKEIEVDVWAKKPLPEELKTVSVSVRDYWGAEQGEPITVKLEKAGKNKRNFFSYKGKADVSRLPLEEGRYYEMHGAIEREGQEPFTGYSSMAVLPEAPNNAYHPMEIPFTSRNWDNRITEYVYLTERLGVRICGIWGSMTPGKPNAPQLDNVVKLNMGYLTGSPAHGVEQQKEGWREKYTEENLRQGVRDFFAKFGQYKPNVVNLGNEPHNKGEDVKEVVNAYRIVYTEIKKVSPDTYVVGSSAGLQEDFFKYGFGEWLDAYDFHVYESAEKVREIIEVRYPEMFKKYGFPKPIWSTELGLNSQGMARQFVAAELYRKFSNFFAGGGANMSWFGLLYPDGDGKAADSFGSAHNVFDCRYNNYAPKVDAIAYYNAVNAIGPKKFMEDKVYEGDIQSFLFREQKPDPKKVAKWYGQKDKKTNDDPKLPPLREGESKRPDYRDRALQIVYKKKGRQDVFLPLAGVKEVEIIRIDGQIDKLNANGKGITLTIEEDPVLVMYEGGGKLADKLGTPAMELVNAPKSLVQGKTATFDVRLNEGTPDQVSLQTPPNWSVKKAAGKDADGKQLVSFTVGSPENSEVREADMTVAMAGSGGTPVGEVFYRPEVTGSVALEILPLPLEEGGKPKIKVVISNNSPDKQSVDWDVSLVGQQSLKEGRFTAVEATDAYFSETPAGAMELAGNETKEIILPLDGADLITAYKVKAVVRDDNGRALVTERNVAGFYGVPKTADKVSVDGKLNDAVWSKAPVRTLDQRDQFYGFPAKAGKPGPDWTGPDDLSADIRYAWDDDFLYLAVDVKDDKTGPEKFERSSLWKQDGIQLLVDPTRTTDRKIGKYDYSMADGKNGPEVWASLSADADAPTGTVDDIQMKVGPGKGGKNNVVYEIAIPWSRLAPFKPGENANLGFTLIVNEDDGKGRDSFMMWFGNAHSKDIDTVGDLILIN